MSRTTLKSITRFLYAGGTIILLAGMLLSTFSKPAVASGISAAPQQSSVKSSSQLLAAPGPFVDAFQVVSPTSAVLTFQGGCGGSCNKIAVQVCNYSGSNMVESVNYELYFAETGSPQDGTIIETGLIAPLPTGSCV